MNQGPEEPKGGRRLATGLGLRLSEVMCFNLVGIQLVRAAGSGETRGKPCRPSRLMKFGMSTGGKSYGVIRKLEEQKREGEPCRGGMIHPELRSGVDPKRPETDTAEIYRCLSCRLEEMNTKRLTSSFASLVMPHFLIPSRKSEDVKGVQRGLDKKSCPRSLCLRLPE